MESNGETQEAQICFESSKHHSYSPHPKKINLFALDEYRTNSLFNTSYEIDSHQ